MHSLMLRRLFNLLCHNSLLCVYSFYQCFCSVIFFFWFSLSLSLCWLVVTHKFFYFLFYEIENKNSQTKAVFFALLSLNRIYFLSLISICFELDYVRLMFKVLCLLLACVFFCSSLLISIFFRFRLNFGILNKYT